MSPAHWVSLVFITVSSGRNSERVRREKAVVYAITPGDWEKKDGDEDTPQSVYLDTSIKVRFTLVH